MNVRRRVADYRNTPSEVLRRLAEDEDDDVRRRVAGNENTPTEVLEADGGEWRCVRAHECGREWKHSTGRADATGKG